MSVAGGCRWPLRGSRAGEAVAGTCRSPPPRAAAGRAALLAMLLALHPARPASARSAPAAPRTDRDACAASALREERLDALGPRGELVFASGGRAILAGLRWPEAGPEAALAEAWLRAYRGRSLTLSARGDEDRWGRVQVDAVADPEADEDPVDLADGLIEAGLALVDAGERDVLCRPDLLEPEARARAAGRGLWREPPRDARDGAALAALDGRFAVAQGRVIAVGERSARTYLDFVRRGESGLTVTVPKRTWRIMQARGLTAEALRGRVVRVRGIVEIRRGPWLDIVSADMIEVQGRGADAAGAPEGGEARGR